MRRSVPITLFLLFFQLLVIGQTFPPSEAVWPVEASPALYDAWHFENPWVAADPYGTGTIFAYASGELLKSPDGGATWSRIGRGLPEGAIFSCGAGFYSTPLTFSPFKRGTMLLGTNRQAVGGVPYLSEDAGETWRPLNICEQGPGYSRNNFKFPAGSVGVFSRTREGTLYFPVVSERACQPVFVSLDGGVNIVPNPQCPNYKSKCASGYPPSFCVDNADCFNYGPGYWGGDMVISASPSGEGFFEFDHHGSLGLDYRARYKVLDERSGQLCAKDNVLVKLDTVPGRGLTGEGFFKSPAFFADDGSAYAVCSIVQTGTSGGLPVYQELNPPFLARCGGEAGGKWLFEFVSFLPEGYGGVAGEIVKLGSAVFFNVTGKDFASPRFLAWDPEHSGTWVRFGQEGAASFSASALGGGQFEVIYIYSFTGTGEETRHELRAINLNTINLTWSVVTRFDFSATNTGVTGFHAAGAKDVELFTGRNVAPFRGTAGEPRYAMFRGAELDIGAEPETLMSDPFNFAFFDEGFLPTAPMNACTSNFTSLAVRKVEVPGGTPELWAYLSSDAGVWRNRRFHKAYDAASPRELLLAFEHVSGGYHCWKDCPGEIPAEGFGNYCRKVSLDPRPFAVTLYAACRSGLWTGREHDDGTFVWQRVFDPPTKTGPDAGVLDVAVAGENAFAVTAEGLLRSADDVLWTEVYNPRQGFGPVTGVEAFETAPWKVVIAAGSSLYGSREGGLFCSDDGGANWYQLAALDPSRELPVRQFQCVKEGEFHWVYYLTFDGNLRRVPAYRGPDITGLDLKIDRAAPCSVGLSWKADNRAVSYIITRTGDGENWETVAEIGDKKVRNYIDSGARGGLDYTYILKVLLADGPLSYCGRTEVVVPGAYSVYSFAPSEGPRSGGTEMVLTGEGLGEGMEVSVGGSTACSACPYDPLSGSISAVVPEIFCCDYPYEADVVVRDACNSVTAPDPFVYYLDIYFATGSLPPGKTGVAYPETGLDARGGVAPYSYNVSGGALPAGLSLSREGTVSGVPSVQGYFTFTATAEDECGFRVSGDFSVSVTSSFSAPRGVEDRDS